MRMLLLAMVFTAPGECSPEVAYQRCAAFAVEVGELECRSDLELCGAAPCEGWALEHCARVWARDRVYEFCRIGP